LGILTFSFNRYQYPYLVYPIDWFLCLDYSFIFGFIEKNNMILNWANEGFVPSIIAPAVLPKLAKNFDLEFLFYHWQVWYLEIILWLPVHYGT
jgi:hypothetical protein